MKRFVALHFLPGSTGNFVSRCINLLDNTYVWAKDKKLPQTLEEKIKILSYDLYNDNPFKVLPWIMFETAIQPYNNFRSHWDIDEDGIAIFPMHPSGVDAIKMYSGPDDLPLNVYINPAENLDWCILNGFNKTSYQTISWFLKAELLENDKSVYKINLTEIINGPERFLSEFTKLANFLNRTIDNEITVALTMLYNQWYPTTLQGIALENYRADAIKIFKKILDCIEK
jgi:hypothetical protein